MQLFWLLLGFGFGNLAMLGWLAAAAAPLLIHLWSRRRYREVPWAAVTFLLAAIRKHSRRIQLQQWLLLAVRTLILVLVVLAVAQPYGQQLGAGVVGPPTHRVLVLDTSYSMAYRDENASRLTQAKRMAAELVRQSGLGDAFTVVTLSDPPRRLLGPAMADRATVAAQIDAIGQSHGRANLAATLELISAALQLDAEARSRFARQEVVVYSDLQRATWLRDESAAEQLRERTAELARQATLVVVDVGTPRAENLAVTGLTAVEPFVTTDRDATFAATVHEFSDQPRAECVVEFLVDDRPVAEQTIDVAAGSDAAVRFTHRFRTAGSHTVAVRVAGDRLDVDNTRWLVVPVEERVDVLCVGGGREAVRYIAEALAPDPTGDSAIRPHVITEGELAETQLEDIECVFLSNIAQLTADEADRLARYVEQGGGLAVFLGDRVVAESYNALVASAKPLLPARLGDVVGESQGGLDPLDYRHPIVSPFRGRERAGLLTTPVRRYYQLQLPAGPSQVEVALSMANGDPLIVTAPLGRGRTVLVATAGSLASRDAFTGEPWTVWPAWPSFLPVVREILAYAAGGRHDVWQSLVGMPLTISERLASGSEALEVHRPDGRTASAGLDDTHAGRAWRYDDTDLSGIYTMRGGAAESPIHFAVNVDTRESDFTKADSRELPPEWNTAADGREAAAGAGSSAAPQAAWHRPLLWIALGLMLVEVCLAWQFGRGAT